MEFGDPDRTLAFNPPIKLTFDGQAGKRAFITETGQGTGEVATTCDFTDPSLVTLPTSYPQTCKANSDNDLIILTGIASIISFGTSSSSSESGGGGGGGNPPQIGDSISNVLSDYKGGFGVTVDFDLNDPDATTILSVGDRLILSLDLYENQGLNNIQHVTLYLSELENRLDNIQKSETFITFEKDEPLIVADPEGFFNNTRFDIRQLDAVNFVLKYEIEFVNPMDYSDILLYMWDGDRNVGQRLFEKAVKVIPLETNSTDVSPDDLDTPEPSEIEPQASELIIDTSTDIPDWIKTNAGWWSDRHITDIDFAKGIEFLIKNDIIAIPQTEILTENPGEKGIPDWVRNTAGWWADGLIPDDGFVSGIKYLVEQGIIRV